MNEPLLTVRGLRMHFPVTEGIVRRRVTGEVKAVDGINFTVARGETNQTGTAPTVAVAEEDIKLSIWTRV